MRGGKDDANQSSTESETKIDLFEKRPTWCNDHHLTLLQMPSFQYFQIFYEQTIHIFYGITLPNSSALKPGNFMGIERRRSDRKRRSDNPMMGKKHTN